MLKYFVCLRFNFRSREEEKRQVIIFCTDHICVKSFFCNMYTQLSSGMRAHFLPEPSSTGMFLLCVCQKRRFMQVWAEVRQLANVRSTEMSSTGPSVYP